MLSEKFLRWIQQLLESSKYRGRKSRLSLDLGQPENYVQRLFEPEEPRAKSKDRDEPRKGNIQIDTLAEMAKAMGFPAHMVLWSIESGEPLPPIPPSRPKPRPPRPRKAPEKAT